MLKIGLITFHRTTNFGSLLQTYGLYKKIVDLGYNCEVIDYRCPAIEKAEYRNYKLDISNPRELIKTILFQPKQNKKAKQFDLFTSQNIKLSAPYNPITINEAAGKYDKFFVGSDIVWGRDITCDDYNYFLEFVNDKEKKYAFSASVGDCIIREDESHLKSLLCDFSRIAVREKDAVEWVKAIANVSADWVCDPTMLLTAEEWRSIVPLHLIKDNYVLVYFDTPNQECLKAAIAYAKKMNLKVYFIKYGLPVKGVSVKQPTSLGEFLSLIDNAKMVFTASYHGMLFSIDFHKEFMFYTRNHSSRVLSLAERLSLQDRCGDSFVGDEYEAINYGEVERRLCEFRNQSISILQEMLQGEKS